MDCDTDMPKVSIIVPVYNVANYLPRTIESIRTQTEPDIEIILVDDGSTDHSGQLCDQYAAVDSRIRAIHKENGGLSSARNTGLNIASGEFVWFIDGDDYVAPNAVQDLLKTLDAQAGRSQIDFIQFQYQEVCSDICFPDTQDASAELCTEPCEMFRRLYQMGGVAASSCTKLFRREVFNSIRFQEGLRHEDEQLMTKLLPNCRGVLYANLVLYAYVMRQDSIVHSKFTPHSLDIFHIMEERISVLNEFDLPALVLETKCRLFQTAAMQYCLARRSGFEAESLELKRRLIELAKEPGLGLSGQYRLLYLLTKFTGTAPELYYQFRRLCGKS